MDVAGEGVAVHACLSGPDGRTGAPPREPPGHSRLPGPPPRR